MEGEKKRQYDALQKGDNIWASMATWYKEDELNRTEYPLSPEQLAMHQVQGTILKKLKYSVDASFPAMQKGRISSLNEDDIIKNSQTFLQHSQIPTGSVVVQTEKDIDFLQGKAPLLQQVMQAETSIEEKVQMLLERDRAFQTILKKQWEQELLVFYLNGVEAIPPSTLVMKLPRFLGVKFQNRTDFNVRKVGQQRIEEMEKMRENVVINMSVKTNTCDNLSAFLGFRVELIEKLHNKLSSKKKNGNIEVEIFTSSLFATNVLVPVFKLTQCFEEVQSSTLGTANFLANRFVGNLQGLKVMGIEACKHPKWAHPFISVEYVDSLAGEIGPHYDALRSEHGGELPYVLNPWELLTREEFVSPNSKVRNELGDSYCYDCTPYKIRHDMEIGRLSAESNNPLRNFGMKQWAMLSSGDGQVIVDFLLPCEGSAGCKIMVTAKAEVSGFSTATDAETGQLAQLLRDV